MLKCSMELFSFLSSHAITDENEVENGVNRKPKRKLGKRFLLYVIIIWCLISSVELFFLLMSKIDKNDITHILQLLSSNTTTPML